MHSCDQSCIKMSGTGCYCTVKGQAQTDFSQRLMLKPLLALLDMWAADKGCTAPW